jgi:hypothetical protein
MKPKIKISPLHKHFPDNGLGFRYTLTLNGDVIGEGISYGTRKQTREKAKRHLDQLGFNDGVDF